MSDKCVHAHLGYCSICSAAEIAALKGQLAAIHAIHQLAGKKQTQDYNTLLKHLSTQLDEKDELIATLNQAMKEIVIEAHEDKVSALKAQEFINRVRIIDDSPEDD